MTRPDPEYSPDNLFEAIARLLEPGQREYFYRRMLYFRQLRPDDEILRIVEALGFLALVIRGAPQAVASEREQLAAILATSVTSIQATAKASQAYHTQLEGRLTELPQEILQGLNPEAIARTIIESVRQQFVQSGLPETAEALKIVTYQLNQATEDLQSGANQLASYKGVADQARRAIEDVTARLANATEAARRSAREVMELFRLEYTWSRVVFFAVAMLLGMLLELLAQNFMMSRAQPVPPSVVPTMQTPAPSPPPQSAPRKTSRPVN